jgi:tetratricopeptide (TPR) repeat protein
MGPHSSIARLTGRLRTALESGGDRTALLDAAVPGLAAELTRALADAILDVPEADMTEALRVLVAVHWARYRLLPDGENEEDRKACMGLSETLLLIAPDLVPEPVRGHLASHAAVDRGLALLQGYEQTGEVRLLHDAIGLFREAIAGAWASDAARPAMLSYLADALQTRFGRTGQAADLDQAIALFREAADATPPGHPGRPLMLSHLGDAFLTRFTRTGQAADLRQAVAAGRSAVEAAPAGDQFRPMSLSNLAKALVARFESAGRPADLDQAIGLFRETAEATAPGNSSRPPILSNLGAALQARFERTGQPADLEQSIAVLQEAVDATPPGHPARPGRLSNLGNALRSRFARAGRPADLERAVAAQREAVAAIPPDHPDRPRYLSNLGNALYSRFGRTGQPADLEQAISALREAVDATPRDHPARPDRLSNLGAALRDRFRLGGQAADLEQAAKAHRQAVDATPAGHPDRPRRLSNLADALHAQFVRTRRDTDLEQAIALHREAVEATPAGHPDRPVRMSNLASAVQARFGRTGQAQDLGQAVALLRDAAEATPADHPDRPAILSNYATALWSRFARTGEPAHLEQAITTLREAAGSAPADHPGRPRILTNLGDVLKIRFKRSGQPADLDEAVRAFREGARVLTASPGLRAPAARRWADCALLAGDPHSAVEGYTLAIELLPLIAWHGLDQATRMHELGQLTGLASDAAAAAVIAGDAARAVELLEAGRSMLWTQASHLRENLTALQRRSPELAAILESSRAVLNKPPGSTPGAADTPGSGDQRQAAELQSLEERRQAARDWDAAVDQVRRISGFEHFLLPVPFAELRPAASAGPVVIVNISPHGSHALIITPPTDPGRDPAVLVQELPTHAGAVIDQANDLLGVLHRTAGQARDWQAREADRHTVLNVLLWCWQTITEPTLTALGHTRTPRQGIDEWPRVWWCPTGPATVLPLHAAGRHPRTATQYAAMGEASAIADSVAGRVISSYTPTLASLTRARNRPPPRRVRQLAIGLPEAPAYLPGGSPLPAVPLELQTVARYLPTPGLATHLVGQAATRQAVLDALPRHSWLHVSSHGAQHPADAALSAFIMHDQPLTLADLAALDLHETDLAYLAACQTAAGDLRLLDEALHLAGALQLIGYRHVLATLWSISDSAAPAMADVIYARLCGPDPDQPGPDGPPQAARAPYALHQAVTRLRQDYPGEPLLWAPYIHLGP